MPDTATINKRLPKVPTQQRSRERFEFILDCAEQLLAKGEREELSIYEVAEQADLPAQSVYRLFPSVMAINYALVQRYLGMIAKFAASADLSVCNNWQEAIEKSLNLSCEFYRQHPQAMELLLGSGASRETRGADRASITQLAEIAIQQLNKMDLIGISEELIRQMEIVIDIADAIWSQSYHHHKDITPFYERESIRAAVSYLGLYLPNHRIENDTL